jgi:hypothetical protein
MENNSVYIIDRKVSWKLYYSVKNPKSVNFFNENLNFNFFYDKKGRFFLKLGPWAGPGSPTFEFAGTGSGRPNVTGSSPLEEPLA